MQAVPTDNVVLAQPAFLLCKGPKVKGGVGYKLFCRGNCCSHICHVGLGAYVAKMFSCFMVNL